MKLYFSSFIIFCLYSKSFHFHTDMNGRYLTVEYLGSLSNSLGILYTYERPTRISAVLSCTNKCGGDRRCIGVEVCKIREQLYQCRACCSWKKLGKEKSNTNEDSCSYFLLENDGSAGYVNVALGKPTSISSTFDDRHGSEYAVDGVVVCSTTLYHMTHTQKEHNPWLRIDLQQTIDILSVLMYARQDCCAGRLTNVMITVSDDVKNRTCGFYPGPTDLHDRILVLCESLARGRFVTLAMQLEPGESSFFQVCEVKVYGKRPLL